ncbi:MAG TPA: hypothetical protein VGM76_18985 [Lacipirellulaceae bacterium]|jgi:hypothetical protein
MQFELYLKSKGVISADQLVAALEVQQKQLVPIGQLAIEEGVLSPRQVFQVLRSQSDSPHEQFGEVAVNLGLMTRDQLQRLLMIQMERKRSLAEILVRQLVISPLHASEELAAFRREKESRNRVVKCPIYATPRKSLEPAVRDVHSDIQFAAGI